MDTNDYQVMGTGGYEVHASLFIDFNHVVNGWMRNVRSFRPAQNTTDTHTLSSGIRMSFSRYITLDQIEMRNAQYQGAGGNGYHFILTGNDCLITRSLGERGRHNFSFAFLWSSGNSSTALSTQTSKRRASGA